MHFKGKTLLITGGTGSFGNAVLERFLDSEIAEIRIFSRDEKKQHDMRIKCTSTKTGILYWRCSQLRQRQQRDGWS